MASHSNGNGDIPKETIEELRLRAQILREKVKRRHQEIEDKHREVERLRQGIAERRASAEQEISAKMNALKQKQEAEVELLRKKVSELTLERDELLQKKSALSQKTPPKSFKEEYHATIEQALSLKSEMADLTTQIEEMQTTVEKNIVETETYNKRRNELEKNILEVKELIKFGEEKHVSLNKELEDMKEEKEQLASELSSLKAGSVGKSKDEPSLFSEVESKRQLMADEYKKAKDHMYNLKAQNEKLKAENKALAAFHQEHEKLEKEHLSKLVLNYSKYNDALAALLRIREKRLEKPQLITISGDDLSKINLIDKIIENARDESVRLNSILERISNQRRITSNELDCTMSQLKELKLRDAESQKMINELNSQLEKYRSKP